MVFALKTWGGSDFEPNFVAIKSGKNAAHGFFSIVECLTIQQAKQLRGHSMNPVNKLKNEARIHQDKDSSAQVIGSLLLIYFKLLAPSSEK